MVHLSMTEVKLLECFRSILLKWDVVAAESLLYFSQLRLIYVPVKDLQNNFVFLLVYGLMVTPE